MNLREKIDRGLCIVGMIAELEAELEGIETAMKAHARDHSDEHQPLGDEGREGRQYLAKGATVTVPVVFTADKLVGSFAEDSEKHVEINVAAAGQFPKFFKKATVFANRFKDGKKFRATADELLGKHAPQFITACKQLDGDGIPKHDVKVEWNQAAATLKLEELAS